MPEEDILRYNGTTDKWLTVGKMKNPRTIIALHIASPAYCPYE